jgi:hypothetical protein
MKAYTFSENKMHINPPNGIRLFMSERTINPMIEIEYEIDNLEHVNFVRSDDGKRELQSLDGYCMSSGCSCRHPDGTKGIPICGLFRTYEADGVKRDFINQLFGI